jgi:hypothetical protein
MMVGLYYFIPEMSSFPMSVANNFCDLPLSKYLDSKTVLIYCPHPVEDAEGEHLHHLPPMMTSSSFDFRAYLKNILH